MELWDTLDLEVEEGPCNLLREFHIRALDICGRGGAGFAIRPFGYDAQEEEVTDDCPA